MRKYFFIAIGLIATVFYFNACKSNSISPSDNSSTSSGASYYPNGDGTSYKYSVVRTDSAGNQITGSRTVLYAGTSVSGTVTYQNELDTITFGVLASITHSLFVKDNNGVSLVLDTTGFYKVIPAAYQPYISISQNIKVFQSSFQNGTPWTVFDIALKYNALSMDLVSVVASYKGMEQIPLSLTSGAVNQSAAKIQYTITIKTPDPNNPLATPTTSTYTAYTWYADKIGVIQVQGNATLLSAFTGSGINFADTTSTITQSLVSYSIK